MPTRTGPCPAAHLRDGHLMPVSPPPVPMLPHPFRGWGTASTNRLEDSTAQPFAPRPHLLSLLCPSVCLYSSRRDILPHIKPQFCPLRPPPEPVFFVATTLCQPGSLTVREQGGVRANALPQGGVEAKERWYFYSTASGLSVGVAHSASSSHLPCQGGWECC